MAHGLDEKRRAIADAHFEAFDFGSYEPESADGWTSFAGNGPGDYSRVVYALPPRADGSRPDPETDDTVVIHFTVSFPGNSAIPSDVTARLNGEDIGARGEVVTPSEDEAAEPDAITPQVALQAILARIDGRFDDAALVRFGALQTDRLCDIARFARVGLGHEAA